MFGRHSLDLELSLLDLKINRTLRQNFKNQIENSIFEMAEEGEKRTLRDYSVPFQFNSPSCIVLPPTTASNFELKHE